MYQGMGSSCVAHAVARALYVSLAAQGASPLLLPSPHFLYWNGRRREQMRDNPGVPAVDLPPPSDVGSYPSLVLEATRELGFCSVARSPYNVLLINDQPPPCAYRHAYDQAGLTWYEVTAQGVGRIEDTRRCLAASIPLPVIFQLEVDRAFTEHNSADPITSVNPEEIVGSHMMTVLGVQEDGGVVVDNWWEDWGDSSGLGIISQKLFASRYVSHLFAILPTPSYSESA